MSEKTIELVKQWIIKGDHDLGTAKVTYLHIPEYLDTVTFHCQQAVEKYLKSFLIYKSVAFKFSHDLIYLSNDKVEKAIRIAKEIRTLITAKTGINIDYNKIIDAD